MSEKASAEAGTTIGEVPATIDVSKRGKQHLRPTRPAPRMEFEELEIRLLFSADPLVASLLGGDALLATQAAATPASAMLSTVPSTAQQQMLAAPAPQMQARSHEVVFVDASIDHAEQLIADLQQQHDGLHIVVIGARQDGLQVISDTLKDQHGVTAIHLISHGDASGIQLGQTFLDQERLKTYAGQVAQWAQCLAPQADILLYGCNLAASLDGRHLVSDLALLTGADVAASTGMTGARSLGGDWALEFSTGRIDAAVAPAAFTQGDWVGVLGLSTAGSETLVNPGAANDTTVTTRQVAMDSSGNYVVVYNAGNTAYVQRYDSNGTALGARTTITDATDTQVAMNASGAFVVAWSAPSSDNILMQRFDAAGAKLDASPVTVATTVHPQLYLPAAVEHSDAGVGIDSAGNVVVSRNVITYLYIVPVSWTAEFSYYASGSTVALTGIASTGGTSALGDATLSMSSDGYFAMSWVQGGEVYARLYNAARAAQFSPVNVSGGGGGSTPSISLNASHDWVAAFNDSGVIKYNKYNGSGASTIGGIQTASLNPVGTTPTDTRSNPSVQMDSTGQFLMAWQNTSQDGSGAGVYLRQFHSDGASGVSDTRVATSTSGAQQTPSVAFNGTKAVVIWHGNGTQAGQSDTQGVFFQRYGVAVNQTPGAVTTTSSSLSYPEGTAATAIDGALALASDPDDDYYSWATVAITNNFLSSQDVLAFTAQNGITGSWNSTTGVMTLSGTASLANYQAALRSVTYYNSNTQNPTTSDRTVTFTVGDGLAADHSVGLTASNTRLISVVAINDAPTATITPATYSATEQTNLTLHGTGLSVADVDASTTTVVATLSAVSGILTVGAGSTGATVGGSGTSTVTLTGTITQINNLLAGNNSATVVYRMALDAPPTTDTLSLSINDQGNTGTGGALTGSDTATINITRINDAPVATIVPTTYAATEQTTLTLHGTGLSISDADAGTSNVQVTLSVGSGALSVAAGTTGVTVSGSGTISVTLTGTVTQINNLLSGNGSGTLTYLNSSNTPGASTTLTLLVSDLGNTGNGGTLTSSDTATINIAAVNDAPVATVTPTTYSATEQTTLTLHGTGLSISDVDAASSSMRVTLSVVSGTLSAAAGTTGVTVSGSGTNTVTLTGTITQINNLLAGSASGTLTYVFSGDAPPLSDTFTLLVSDQGNTGSGGAQTSSDSATINITRVNDSPTGVVSIAGAATQGQTLTASNTLADGDGMGTVSYQWRRNGVAVSGATSSTYVLTQADVGSTMSVLASYTDAQGTAESRASAATAAVANVNDLPTGNVTISGTTTQGSTLTAGNTLLDADGLGAITYQWLRNGVAVGGATGGTYALTIADVGSVMSVRASYTDGQGTAESVTSLPTAAITGVNSSPTGTVDITGTAAQGQTLTASHSLADIDGLGTISYQWWRNGVAINGATGSTYLLTQGDVGSTLTVEASYVDGQGTFEDVYSNPTAAVANVNDLPTGSVIITGTATQGQTLTATDTLADADGMGAVSYQWLRNGVAIAGATSDTLVLTQSDVGTILTVRASYVDGFGASESVLSNPTAAVANVNDAPTGGVTISGTTTQGQTLTANHTLADIDGLGTISYQWLRDGVAISGATGGTHVLTEDDVDATLTVEASYTDGQGTSERESSSPTAVIANLNDAPTGSVIISGTQAEGQLLSASNSLMDLDGMGTVTYQWLRNGVALGGATSDTYLLTQADVGTTLTVQASYVDARGASESAASAPTAPIANVNDAPTGTVSISGTATQGQVLTATHTLLDDDGMGTVSYQWLREGVAIAGATSDTYVLTQSDVDATLTVVASYTDGQGTSESVSSDPTGTVANVNDLPTGGVLISGIPTQGQTLTASHTLVDIDGLGTVSYQWLRDGVAITGATSDTYVLTQSDVDATLTVVASYTDDQGTPESMASSATAIIANINDAPTGNVIISGTLTQYQTLTATHTLDDLDGMGTVSYQWLRDGVAIAGATSDTYVLTQDDVGNNLTVVASYVDARGASESVASNPTAVIANVNDLPTGAVSISGTPTQGQALTATHTLVDLDGLGTVSYQWLRDGVAITGATSDTYVLTQSDVDATLTVVASYTDGQGTDESVASGPTAVIANINDAPTGNVIISGTLAQGQTLTATNTLDDLDGLGTVSYQWLRDGVAITGATGDTHVLTQDDVGHTLTAEARYTDARGANEFAASNPTAAIANLNDAPAGGVLISGTTMEGRTLTASHTLVDADGLGTISYQWVREGLPIIGATGSTYTATGADIGRTITVYASYVDGWGSSEGVSSLPTAAIRAAPSAGDPRIDWDGLIDRPPTPDTKLTEQTNLPSGDISMGNPIVSAGEAASEAATESQEALTVRANPARRPGSYLEPVRAPSQPGWVMGARPGFNVDLATDRHWHFRDWSWILPDALLTQASAEPSDHHTLLLVQGLRTSNTAPQPIDFSLIGALTGGQGMAEAIAKVSPVKLETGGLVLSLGSVWWAARGASLLTGLLATTPVWRQIDPLPIMMTPEDKEEGQDMQVSDENDERAEALFVAAREHDLIG